MSGADEGAEKELEPTDRKLEQAREKEISRALRIC